MLGCARTTVPGTAADPGFEFRIGRDGEGGGHGGGWRAVLGD